MRAAGADFFDKNFGDHRALPQCGRISLLARERGVPPCSTSTVLSQTAVRRWRPICPHGLVRELVARAVSGPIAVLERPGEPKQAGVQKLHHAGDLTILNITWGPR